jgi:hypothetical protein
MTDAEPTAHGLAVAYRCSGCSRSFIDLGEASSRELVCACGAPLTPHPLPHGLHELGAGVQHHAHKAAPASGAIPKEPDHGYGASHGYDVTHGGPSGPGDAPADVPDETT